MEDGEDITDKSDDIGEYTVENLEGDQPDDMGSPDCEEVILTETIEHTGDGDSRSSSIMPEVSDVYNQVQCIVSEGSNDQTEYIIAGPNDPLGDGTKAVWTRYMVSSLIEEYKKMIDDFKNPMQKQKDLWIKVAREMVAEGHDVTWDMCDRKWRNLKHTFKTIYYNKKRSLRSKKKWEFYSVLLDVFIPNNIMENHKDLRKSRVISPPSSPSSTPRVISKSVTMTPVTVTPISVAPNSMAPVSSAITVGSFQVPQQVVTYPEVILCDSGPEQNDHSSPQDTQEGTHYFRAESEPPPWFQDFLQQYRKDEERKLVLLREMHNEIMHVEKRKCAILESLLKKFGESSNK